MYWTLISIDYRDHLYLVNTLRVQDHPNRMSRPQFDHSQESTVTHLRSTIRDSDGWYPLDGTGRNPHEPAGSIHTVWDWDWMLMN